MSASRDSPVNTPDFSRTRPSPGEPGTLPSPSLALPLSLRSEMTFLHMRKLALTCTLVFLFPDAKSHVLGSFTVKLIHDAALEKRERNLTLTPPRSCVQSAPAADPMRLGSPALLPTRTQRQHCAWPGPQQLRPNRGARKPSC